MILSTFTAVAPYCSTVDAGRLPLSIDIFCVEGALQQTRPQATAMLIDGTGTQTDTRLFNLLYRPCSGHYAGSVDKVSNSSGTDESVPDDVEDETVEEAADDGKQAE